MRKFECRRCAKTCTLLLDENLAIPRSCIYGNRESLWCVIQEKSEQPSNPHMLPDWVKVGAIGYDPDNVGYYKVIAIRNGYIDILYLEDHETEGGMNYDNTWNSKQAIKRLFNADEMKSLVGKVVVDNRNNISLVTDYDFFTERICVHGEYLNNNDLIDYDITIDGKPCYKLEHLNDKGEWVESNQVSN